MSQNKEITWPLHWGITLIIEKIVTRNFPFHSVHLLTDDFN